MWAAPLRRGFRSIVLFSSSTAMFTTVLSGSCGGIAATIVIDPARSTSIVSTRFALAQNICRTISRVDSRTSFSTHAPIMVPTPSGWYLSSMDTHIGFVDTYDVLLGVDWLVGTRARLSGSVVLDAAQELSGNVHRWERSPIAGTATSV
ncbi:hypothetical protein C2E23DRAFT_821028 [Lenzites betulinus]|nr:hypothetical protein C2E23DRAFT_821028 [Lenzites betulinus]